MNRTHARRSWAMVIGLWLSVSHSNTAYAQQAAAPNAARAVTGDSVSMLRSRIDSLLLRQLRPTSSAQSVAAALGVAYLQLGSVLEGKGVLPEAMDAYRRAITASTTGYDSVTFAGAHGNLGLVHWTANRYDSALVHLDVARRIRRLRGDQAGLGRVTNSIGATFYQLGDYEQALEAFLEAHGVSLITGKRADEARTLTNIAKTYQDWKQYPRALQVMDSAVAVSRLAANDAVLGYALNSMAMLYIDVGEFARARTMISQSSDAYNRRALNGSVADSLSGWSLNAMATGRLLVQEGRAAEAVPILESVRVAGAQRGSVRGQARALLYLGEARLAQGDQQRAMRDLQQSLEFSRRVSQRVLALDALQHLATVAEGTGRPSMALSYLRSAVALRDTIFDQNGAQRIASMESRRIMERDQLENARLRDAERSQRALIARQRLAVVLGGIIVLLAVALVVVLVSFNRRGRVREAELAVVNRSLGAANAELTSALAEVKALEGLIPICASCKNVRDDRGYWHAVETYITGRSAATFSHSMCQTCGPALYGDMWPTEEEVRNAALLDAADHSRNTPPRDS